MPSSEDLVHLLLLSENSILKRRVVRGCKRGIKRWGVHPINRRRRVYGEYHHLIKQLKEDPERFFQYTRMSVPTFDFILNRLKGRLEKKRIGLLQQVKPEERLVVTLRFLATGASFTHLAFEFRLGRSTVGQILYSTCKAIVEEFGKEYIPEPTEESLKLVAERYMELWKFPNCIGAIDGRHCELKCPPHGGSTCFNYLKYHSIVLMGVADADKKFIVIDVGALGKQSDGGIFTATELYRRLESNQLSVPPKIILPGTTLSVPPVLIGDEAFPLKPYLMRPYPSKRLTPEKEQFNTDLSCARKTIECAFGILRAKWRFLGSALEIPSIQKVSLLVQTACTLHNIVRTKDGTKDHDYVAYMRGELIEELPRVNEYTLRNPSTEAVMVRNKYKYYFVQRKQQNIDSDHEESRG